MLQRYEEAEMDSKFVVKTQFLEKKDKVRKTVQKKFISFVLKIIVHFPSILFVFSLNSERSFNKIVFSVKNMGFSKVWFEKIVNSLKNDPIFKIFQEIRSFTKIYAHL